MIKYSFDLPVTATIRIKTEGTFFFMIRFIEWLIPGVLVGEAI